MITEDYCSYSLAQLLQEKETDDLFKCYHLADDEKVGLYKTVTRERVMKWMREVRQLHISVVVCPVYGKVKDEKGRNTCSLLYWHYMASGEWMNEKYNPQRKAFVVSEISYEKAVEAALKYILENLI